MSKEKEAEQEDLGWLHTEQLWEVKQSSHNGREVRVQIQPSLLSAGAIWGRLLNLSLSFVTYEIGFMTHQVVMRTK